MVQIEWIREGKKTWVPEGTLLLDALRMAGIRQDAPCGGMGRCGKCRVKRADTGETLLACRTRAEEDLRILTEETDRGNRILTESVGEQDTYAPHFRKVRMQVEPCPPGKSISDWERFCDALLQTGAVSAAPEPIPYTAGRLAGECRKNGGQIQTLLFRGRPLEVSAEDIPVYMAAFDIGTTTVAGYLLKGEDGSRCAVASRMNPQAVYGADVISRSAYSLEHGMEELTGEIRRALREMLRELADQAGISTGQIYLVSVAGNTCMHHMFLGIRVDSLVQAPYNPAVQESMILPASELELGIHPVGQVLVLPNIAGFVGADTVACLTASDLAEQKDWTLLIDIGTNGEMVLGRDHRLAACSTAAGPAFEGAGISCGMRGSAGAIHRIRRKGAEWELSVIGEGPGTGICGSGLLDLAAELLRTGQMDETGELEAGEVILIPAEVSGTGRKVSLVQKDVRELQMAKAAIRSGIQLLAASQGIRVEEIRQVWLAGAFGSFMDPASACAIGMIPPELKDRIRSIGNAAGRGAQLVLQDRSRWELAASLASEVQFLELASLPEFQDTFVDSLEFPEP